jgi:hypothetical protein
MNDLEHPLGTVLHLRQERRAPVLAGETPITQLIDMINLWESVHPIFSRHLPDCLEIEMAQACVTPPCLLTPREQANRLCKVGIEHI